MEVAQAIHRNAAELLFRHSRELLHAPGTPAGVLSDAEPATRLDELVALGASIGANCHPLVEQHISGALQQGLTTSQVRSAIKMAEIVQQHAAEITAAKAATALEADQPNPAAVS